LPNGVERLVINTGPLISLGRAGALDIIEQLPIRFLAPQEVAQEIEAGERTGLPVVMPSWVEVLVRCRRITEPVPPPPVGAILSFHLDALTFPVTWPIQIQYLRQKPK